MTKSESRNEFVKLLTEHQARLAVFVRSLVPNASAAKDVLQETHLTLWSKADQFQLGTDFWAWSSCVAYFEVQAYRTRMMRDRCLFNNDLLQQLATMAEKQSDFDEARQTALRHCLEKCLIRRICG